MGSKFYNAEDKYTMDLNFGASVNDFENGCSGHYVFVENQFWDTRGFFCEQKDCGSDVYCFNNDSWNFTPADTIYHVWDLVSWPSDWNGCFDGSWFTFNDPFIEFILGTIRSELRYGGVGPFTSEIDSVVRFDKMVKEKEKKYRASHPHSQDNSGCFITTAVCQSFDKADDCYELTMFRYFRDNWLKNQPDGFSLIQKYYDIAPNIVNTINKKDNNSIIYRNIWNEYLVKCLNFIEKKQYNECKNLYKKMVYDLGKLFLK